MCMAMRPVDHVMSGSNLLCIAHLAEKRERLAPGKRSHVGCNSGAGAQGGTVISMRGRPRMIANRAKCTVL